MTDSGGRQGGRPGLPVVWSETYEVDIGPHVYPTEKYRLARERLLEESVLSEEQIRRPSPAPEEDLARVHTTEYLRKIREGSFSRREELVLEVPFSPALREAAVTCAGGSTLTARLALEAGVAVHLGGGFHHAFPDHGEGFCLINDVAVAARALQARAELGAAAVVDCDVHHGNGTAAIFADDPSVYAFSIHQQWNYPAHKPPGDLDVGLADGTGDREYLETLERRVREVLGRAEPELVLYLAGADPYREDQLGGLALTREGLRERDRLVVRACQKEGAAVAVLLAGGYARRLQDTVGIHCATVATCAEALAAERPGA